MITVLGVIGISAFAPIEPAVLAPGYIRVPTERQRIQHYEGGILVELKVREGDIVEQGATLATIADTRTRADLEVLELDLLNAQATHARLLAERKGKPDLQFPAALVTRQSEPKIERIMNAERHAFLDRKSTLQNKLRLLEEEMRQAGREQTVLTERLDAVSRAAEAAQGEYDIFIKLHEAKFFSQARLLQQQRIYYSAVEREKEVRTSLAALEQKRTRLARERDLTQHGFNEQITRDLAEIERAMVELEEKLRPARDQVERTVVRAPMRGSVVNLKTNTLGGVLKPGDVLMEIVPDEQELVVESRIRPEDIDQVIAGAKVKVELTALRAGRIPVLDGKIIYVSADSEEGLDGARYYLAKASVSWEDNKEVPAGSVIPGMPVTIAVKTGEKTLLEYMLDPLAGFYWRTLR